MRTSPISIVWTVLAVVPMLLAVGCGDGKGSVEGRLTVGGQEVTTGALITFIGPTGEKAQALVKSDGSFFAENVPAGKVEVTVESAPLPPTEPSKERPEYKRHPYASMPKQQQARNPGNQVPDRYGSADNGLTFTIKPRQCNIVQIELTP